MLLIGCCIILKGIYQLKTQLPINLLNIWLMTLPGDHSVTIEAKTPGELMSVKA